MGAWQGLASSRHRSAAVSWSAVPPIHRFIHRPSVRHAPREKTTQGFFCETPRSHSAHCPRIQPSAKRGGELCSALGAGKGKAPSSEYMGMLWGVVMVAIIRDSVAALCGDAAGDRATDESVSSSPPKRRADPRSPTSSSSASELVTMGLASWPLLAKMLRLAACREGVGRGGGSGRPGASQVGGGGRKRSDYEKCNASTARHAGWPPRCTDTRPVLVHARMISHATPHKVHSGSTHGDRGTDRCGGGAPVACR
eukprot:scaffold14886_cov127-Isochrysis_galbana.AAC.2